MKAQVLEKSAGRVKTCRPWEKVQVLQMLLVSLLVTGCAAAPTPEIRYVRVEVPVQVPCRAPAVPVPVWATAGLKKSDTPETKVLALLAERRQRIGYERLLESAVGACR
ncbi:hypothetical protein [Pseudomonas sp. A014]|uniref:hypothetical protein n=1 Tax=Pseudomonas sp. A014 TaxID=3458058 RepID=UPI0040353196